MPRHVRRRRSRPSGVRALVEEPHVRPFLPFQAGARSTVAPRPVAAAADPTGDTATVRRIVAKLEAMPPEQARLIASAAYTLARAANADLDISDEETAAIERELQVDESLDEATAVLVTEMAKLQAKTVGGTEDYVVTREFKALADRGAAARGPPRLLRDRRRQRHDLRRGDRDRQRDRRGARHRRRHAQRDPRRLPRAAVVGPGDPAGHRRRADTRGGRGPASGEAAGRPARRPAGAGPRRAARRRRRRRGGAPSAGPRRRPAPGRG